MAGTDCSHHQELSVLPARSVLVQSMPFAVVNQFAAQEQSAGCQHSQEADGVGWYVVAEQDGLRCRVIKVGMSASSALGRVCEQERVLRDLALTGSPVVVMAAATHLRVNASRDFLHRVEFLVANTVRRAERWGLLTFPGNERDRHRPEDPSRADADWADTVASELLAAFAAPLRVSASALLAAQERRPGWEPAAGVVAGVRSRRAWLRTRGVYEAGLLLPGDTLLGAGGRARATVNGELLLSVEGLDGAWTPREALTQFYKELGAAHGLSPHTRREGFAGWRKAVGGQTLAELEAQARALAATGSRPRRSAALLRAV